MSEFPHLPLPKKESGNFKPPKRKIDIPLSDITRNNLANRVSYGKSLRKKTDDLLDFWEKSKDERRSVDLPDLPDNNSIPVLLRVDTNLFKTDSLFELGIEVISEEEDGYIIGAAADNFKALRTKIAAFINDNNGKSKQMAQLWEIVDGTKWRLDYILSEELNSQWDLIPDANYVIVDVSIACGYKTPTEPRPKTNKSKSAFNKRYSDWQIRKAKLEEKQLEIEEVRQDEFASFLQKIGGERLSAFVSLSDSFSCRIRLRFSALKDLVINYQYLFDVTEFDSLIYAHPTTGEQVEIEVRLESPDPDDPKVCVIDSGIQEEHSMISFSMETGTSKCYLPNETDTSDLVANGGHGTKVAGAVIFGNEIPKYENFKSNVWIQNAKVLNNNKQMPASLFPPELMQRVVSDFQNTILFNLSITSYKACKTKHMSEWAASIDKLTWNKNILFFIATGNIDSENSEITTNPGIKDHIFNGRQYPNYLFERSSRIANPAQSCFALTVGSVCLDKHNDNFRESFGSKHEPSSFTRSGLGLWGMIKPDVVEVGGDWIREKSTNPNLSILPQNCAELIKTTFGNGNSIGYDIGTSFSTPKVAHIAAKIIKEVSNNALLIRALIVQSARLPSIADIYNPTLNRIRTYGYGIPNGVRATENTAQRITLTSESAISAKQAQIYSIKIPEAIRAAGNEYEILIEVTLSFKAEPRRTRRKTNSYLSTWLDWQTSKTGEDFNKFRRRIIKSLDGEDSTGLGQGSQGGDDGNLISWKIRERLDWGTVQGVRRQDSSIQKDWATLKSFELPSEFSIAVVGHKGWEKDVTKEVPYSLVVSFEAFNTEIPLYELISLENEIQIENELPELLAFPDENEFNLG